MHVTKTILRVKIMSRLWAKWRLFDCTRYELV